MLTAQIPIFILAATRVKNHHVLVTVYVDIGINASFIFAEPLQYYTLHLHITSDI